EEAAWTPGGIPTGSYEIIVYYEASCEGDNPVDFNVVVSVDGRAEAPIRGTVNPGDTFVTSFVINPDGTVSVSDRAGLAADQTLPASPAELLAAAQPIAIGETVTGFIGSSRPYVTYAFQATPDDLLTIDLAATSGSLDTFVALLDSNGNIVRSNDDRERGNTDSLIADALVPSAGVYTIVVTRYAKAIGGTEGNYVLSLTAQPSELPEEFASLPRGSIEVRLLWRTNADLQLLVRDPAGSAVFDDVPQIRSGGVLAAQGNVNCRISEGTPFSYIYWPQQIPPRPGSYEIEVWFQNQCGDPTPVSFNLYVSVNGQEIFSDVAQPLPGDRYLTSFTVLPDGTVQPSLGGIIRGVADLDYTAELEAAPIVLSGQPVTGAITPDNKFDVYVFQGTAGQVVTLAMNATSGTLDTALYLIGPLNTVVAENDDAVVGENTNSLIANFTLPQDGRYIIIATHFGTLYGGTTGTYQLTLTQLN
ncbi:MAG: PPC domain-containing protein, partial [Anaerolinea sp.]|nr:PPC domain-containing protein [Anaerolinea sp.]